MDRTILIVKIDLHMGMILIIEDDPAFRRFLRNTLAVQRYDVREAENGQQGIALALHAKLGLIMLDLGLPDMDGMDVIRLIRSLSEVPILVVSNRGDEEAKATALDLGADDYISKPCTAEELTTRIRSVFRDRPVNDEQKTSRVFSNAGLTVDVGRGVVTVEGQEIELSDQEFGILREFVLHAGRALTHRRLLQAAWGNQEAGDVRFLRTCIRRIREKIELSPARPRHIVTEAGIGYRLEILNEST
jgi:two-component system KDP operon response regulator KdpE